MKKAARLEILKRRDALTPEEREAKSKAIADRLRTTNEYRASETILFYIDFRSEVMTRKIVDMALRDGKRVLAPRVEKSRHRLRLFELTEPARELEPGYMGIPEPDPYLAREAEPEEIEMVVLPGVGFDEKCWRLGYGGGYYDRLVIKLNPMTPLIGLAYEVQIEKEIPREKHDKRLNAVITEERVIRP